MTFQRDEFHELMEKQGKERVNGQRTNLEMIRQAALKGEVLTGDQHWDTFLTYIQAAIEKTESVRDAYRMNLEASALVDANEIMAIRVGLLEANAMIAAWNAVLQLPKDLREQGGEAEKLLDRLNG